MTPSRNPYGLTLCPTAHLYSRGLDHDRHVAGPPADPGGTALRPGPEPPKRRPLVHPRPRNHQVLGDGLLLLRVRHRRLEDLGQRAVRPQRRHGEDTPGVVDLAAAA